MQYLRARYYEPEMMRFSQQDLVRGSVVVPISLNRYLYVQNNPVLYSDPSGMVAKAAICSIAVSSAGDTKKAVATKTVKTVKSAAKVTSSVSSTVRKTATTAPKASSKITKADTNNKQGAISTLSNAVKNVTQLSASTNTKKSSSNVRGASSSGSCTGSTKLTSTSFSGTNGILRYSISHLFPTLLSWGGYGDQYVVNDSDVMVKYEDYQFAGTIPPAVAHAIDYDTGFDVRVIRDPDYSYETTYIVYDTNPNMQPYACKEYVVYNMSKEMWQEYCNDYEYKRVLMNTFTSAPVEFAVSMVTVAAAGLRAIGYGDTQMIEFIANHPEQITFAYDAACFICDVIPSEIEMKYLYSVETNPYNTEDSVSVVVRTTTYSINTSFHGLFIYREQETEVDGQLYIENWDPNTYEPEWYESWIYGSQNDDQSTY